MNVSSPVNDSQLFSHEAMNTVFSLWLRDVSPLEAAGVARVCWDAIDLLESQLSRFIDTSDIARVNTLSAGKTLYLSEDCHRCVMLGLQAYSETGGLFDITLGARIAHLKSKTPGPPPGTVGSLIIHPDVPAVTCVEPGRILDLGGIGKGFALDRVRELLADWGGNDALITAGASSMLASGPTRWPIELSGESNTMVISLENHALSASGTTFQGDHIVHPAGDEALPATPNKRVWVTAATATAAEVASTALMLVSADDAPELLACVTGVSAAYIDCGHSLTRVF